jgi:predicted CXXCH cytochrome family protein
MSSFKGKNRLLICCALAFAFSIYGWVAPGRASAADDSPACTDCHDDKQDFKFVHNPAQEGFCEGCHEPTPKHLEEGGPGGMKTNRTASACYQCHDAKDEGKNLHPALEMDGECVQCHNPHGSDNEQFLVLPKSRLCFECHDPIPSDAAGGSDHGVVTDEKSCLNCHDPHSSDRDSLLAGSQRALCLGCHDREIEVKEGEQAGRVQNIKQRLDMQSVHEPATGDEGCTSCHAPHGSKYKNLLVAAFPAENYNKYEPGDGTATNTFDLCFTCHEQAMLNETITADDTGFRDDTARSGAVVRRNLHWLHVVDAAGSADKSRGRSCNICHDPHGTIQPHLIRSWWPMRSSQMILKFESSPNGGECLKSCHSPKRYQRID